MTRQMSELDTYHIHQYHLHINGISEPQPPTRNPSLPTSQIERVQTK